MATAELPSWQPRPRAPVIVLSLCVAALLFESTADVLPDTPFLGVITWQRLVIVTGLVAAVAAGARPGHFRTRLDIPIAALLLAGLVATLRWGTDAEFRHLLSFVAVYFLVTALVRLEPTAVRVIGTLAAVAVAVAGAVAIGQFSENVPTGFCRSGLLRDAACEPGVLVRATGTFANPNLLAAFLLLLVPLGTLAVTMIADRHLRIYAVATTVLAYAALLVTFSRAAYVAALAGMLVLAWRWARTRLSPGALRIAGWAAAAVLVLALGAIAVMSRAGKSLGVRNEAWAEALRISADHPLGVGIGRAGDVVNARIDGSVEFVHVHNLWLNWLVETGLLGFSAMVVITLGALLTAFGLARRGLPLGFAGLASLAGFLTMNLMDNPANLGRIAVVFWLALGVVMGAATARWGSGAAWVESRAERPATSSDGGQPPRHRRARTARAVARARARPSARNISGIQNLPL
ncbi:O-antigen ligase family protein [Myceligenerans pegani]|uniref:O-antigen ligase family protein n=1 Tax=Myceligenerans pegani TaxID=2776917 RepID=A0ABR9N3Z8_9MICO|nr:O-antigen ligase family protein [Myceligenerans sp. TRM 65318]MBE1878383.1 O-antigen ligase family protein [Myceligenerans sp. TRM 65318]MBE3020654.1 O-antigen ligase family protein [Myceligenerans sp. TRM 65318]